jgi:hypothetical protein
MYFDLDEQLEELLGHAKGLLGLRRHLKERRRLETNHVDFIIETLCMVRMAKLMEYECVFHSDYPERQFYKVMKADHAVVKEALAGVYELPAILSFSPSVYRIGRWCHDNDNRSPDGSSHASTWSRSLSPEITITTTVFMLEADDRSAGHNNPSTEEDFGEDTPLEKKPTILRE